MTWQKKYLEWEKNKTLASDLKEQLLALSNPVDLEERFYQYLAFGTGGMRGELGVGTNRMNIYIIKRVALGLAKYILESGDNAASRGVVISYDNRHYSEIFAKWTARVLASQGVKAYLSDQLRPTPELSFLVRNYKAFAGVMITASHNPKEYNGFKVYGEDGGQITLETAQRLTEILDEINYELEIEADKTCEYIHQGLIEFFGNAQDSLYLDELSTVIQNKEMVSQFGNQLNIVYTPLHGTGRVLIRDAFNRFGFKNLQFVEEQEYPNPDFSTVKSPNPEDPHAFDLAIKKAKKNAADFVFATDPDADRLGIALLHNKKTTFLNGNQIGILILDYLIKQKRLAGEDLSNYFLAKTIVTSDLGEKIAIENAIETKNTLTGFKFIGEQILLEEIKNGKNFLFGYEESYGYLIKPFVRDKDAIQAATILAEVALDCQMNSTNLLDRLNEIYQKYGFYLEELETKTFLGKDGINQMKNMLTSLRNSKFSQIGNFTIAKKEDYLTSSSYNLLTKKETKLLLPQSNVLKYIFTDESWVCVRPSGTEPKFKIYYSVNANTKKEALNKMDKLKSAFQKII